VTGYSCPHPPLCVSLSSGFGALQGRATFPFFSQAWTCSPFFPTIPDPPIVNVWRPLTRSGNSELRSLMSVRSNLVPVSEQAVGGPALHGPLCRILSRDFLVPRPLLLVFLVYNLFQPPLHSLFEVEKFFLLSEVPKLSFPFPLPECPDFSLPHCHIPHPRKRSRASSFNLFLYLFSRRRLRDSTQSGGEPGTALIPTGGRFSPTEDAQEGPAPTFHVSFFF